MRRIRRFGTTIGAALLAAAVLAGCSAGAGMATDESAVVPGVPVAPDSVQEGGDAGGFAAEDADRSVIVTGWMTVTVEQPLDAARDAVRIVETAGGRVDARSEYAPTNGDAGSASLTLRIPAERLQDVVDELAELGRADEVSTNSSDVTTQVADLESRIETQRGIIDRLQALFERAESIEDLIELETRIAQHQAELEALEAQQRSVDDQIALSTLSLTLRSEAQAPDVAPGDFWSGLQTGWGAFVAFFSGLLVALGVLLPWIATVAILTAAIVLLVKWRRRRAADGA